MEDSSKSSFIPKRGSTRKRKHHGPIRHVYLFTIVGYVLMFATLLSSGGVYLYGNYVDTQLNTEIVALASEIKIFSKADMKKVIDFDSRLAQASDKLKNSVSFVSVLESLEAATIDTVKIVSLIAEREEENSKFIVSADIETDSFDSTIFQRGVYERNQIIESVEVSGLTTVEIKSLEEANASQVESGEFIVTFVAKLDVPLSLIPFDPNRKITQQPLIINEKIEETVPEPEVESLDSNEENI
jgi:hypothetical protein